MQLAVLTACQGAMIGATPTAAGLLSGVAPTLIHAGVPLVVAHAVHRTSGRSEPLVWSPDSTTLLLMFSGDVLYTIRTRVVAAGF